VMAQLISALALKRSILTEKVARRGFHVMREYAVDPLEALFVREVMRTRPRVVGPRDAATVVREALERDPASRRQRLYPVVDDGDGMIGAVAWSHLADAEGDDEVATVMEDEVVVAYPDEVLRTAATRMAAHRVGALPVVDRDDPTRVLGVITEFELLGGRRRQLEEERKRERPLRLRRAQSGRTTTPSSSA